MSEITGGHVLLFTRDAEADRAFLRDVLGFGSVDAGGGWLIFRLPPSELAVHPSEDEAEGPARAELYLICDDVASLVESLRSRGVECSDISDEGWGLTTSMRLPSGSDLGLYEPRHPTAWDEVRET